jgi:DNA-binding GntR family transcriptional regulator
MNELNSFSAPSSRQDDDALSGLDGELSAAQERFRTIYHTIRERIALIDYRPGERLSEVDLADEFGVSRTPVRRVLARLETEGLLESRHGVGTFVTTLDMDELRDIYRLRKELAALIGTLSPNPVTPDILAAMIALQNQCRLVARAPDPKKAFSRTNIAFFSELMRLVGNEPLRQTQELLFYRTARMWPAMTTDEVIIKEAEIFHDEIRDTVQALQCGNLESAGYLRQAHISMALSRLEGYVAAMERTA